MAVLKDSMVLFDAATANDTATYENISNADSISINVKTTGTFTLAVVGKLCDAAGETTLQFMNMNGFAMSETITAAGTYIIPTYSLKSIKLTLTASTGATTVVAHAN